MSLDQQLASSFLSKGWEVPAMRLDRWLGRTAPSCVVIPVINEGARIASLLAAMNKLGLPTQVDIIIVDGGSTDGSLNAALLDETKVRGLITKTGPGKLSAQLRCAYAFALEQGYEGIVTIDGNNKDDPEAIPRFLHALAEGYDFVQASRFVQGGIAENTPSSRHLAIKLIHAPLLSWASGFKWTDTTQGFRAYSRRMMLTPQLAPFRKEFIGYELLAYLSYAAPRLKMKCIELPSARRYPKGEVPTKISSFRGNLGVLMVLFKVCAGYFGPSKA